MSATSKFIKQLPFALTVDQTTAISEIREDLAQARPMNRLLQGDVGSGKSVVALVAIQHTLRLGYKVFYLAPTEILAQQQADSFQQSLGLRFVDLLTGSSTARTRRHIKACLQHPDPFCLVGTHALLEDKITSSQLALVVVDEQHRFGVKQRAKLLQPSQGSVPHLLSMTATPIPRTLNLTVYGDLDVSTLRTMPAGRRPIATSIVPPHLRAKTYIKVLSELHAGRQAYIIAPLVEKSDKLQAKSATETYQEIVKFFPGIATALVHGRLSSDEKKSIMNNFNAGAIQLLCSTAVVEVGVNVPNVTCMIIEGAERFGLAQLHQFRGRIGRGRHQSYCYLFPTDQDNLENERLTALASTTDGFKIAEQDLRLRGPGEIYGTEQSGYGHLKVASLLDYPTIKMARQEAARLLKHDPQLTRYPILRKKIAQKNKVAHFE